MLTINIEGGKFFDNKNNMFITTEPVELRLEHSLISLSKWESKWTKPFLDNKDKTSEEMIDYIRCMTLNKNVDPKVYYLLTNDDLSKIKTYIDAPMTATWFSEDKRSRHPRSREIVTAEIIYYWMIAQNIPPEYQKWHLNRLLTLIRVCSVKNAPPKKMRNKDIMRQNQALNAARRRATKSRG